MVELTLRGLKLFLAKIRGKNFAWRKGVGKNAYFRNKIIQAGSALGRCPVLYKPGPLIYLKKYMVL